jgi:hypothetical protein
MLLLDVAWPTSCAGTVWAALSGVAAAAASGEELGLWSQSLLEVAAA